MINDAWCPTTTCGFVQKDEGSLLTTTLGKGVVSPSGLISHIEHYLYYCNSHVQDTIQHH